jgi:acetylornithine deacetylase
MNDLERRALEAIDLGRLLTDLRNLIALPSCDAVETPVQQHAAGIMRELGMDVDEWWIHLDTLSQHPAYHAEFDRKEALGVVGQFGSGDRSGHGSGRGATLVLNGHTDVVPAGDLDRWTKPPWEGTIADGRVYGRGSVDMKGGLCCAFAATRAIAEAGIQLAGTLKIQAVVGEEDGGMGTLAAIERGHTGDAAIVLEPTELMIAPSLAGAMMFRITVPGLAAHGALRTEGVDPIERFVPIFQAARAFEAQHTETINDPLFETYEVPYPLCIGTLSSGIWASNTSEVLTCEGRLGVAAGEDPLELRREFEEAIAAAAAEIRSVAGGHEEWLRDNPPTVAWWGAQFMPAATPLDHGIVRTVMSAHADVTGEEPVVRGMPYGADMHLLPTSSCR